jgi:hypothetical protein
MAMVADVEATRTVPFEWRGAARVPECATPQGRPVQDGHVTEYMPVVLTNDHLRQMRRSAPTGLLELIKNALDADADDVAVTFTRDGLDAITEVTISDDGAGMNADEVQSHFQPLSQSWKRTARRARHAGSDGTLPPRDLFGRKGEGRLTAFAIGDTVEWATTAPTPAAAPDGGGRLSTHTIKWNESQFDRFAVTELEGTPEAPRRRTGTVVKITDLRRTAERLTTAATRHQLELKLGVYLEKYPAATVTVDGQRLDPRNVQRHRQTFTIAVGNEATASGRFADASPSATLTVIEWATNVSGALWLTTGGSQPYAELPVHTLHPGIAFTARLDWDGWPAMGSDVGVATMAPDTSDLIDAALTTLNAHLKARSAIRTGELLEDWKAEGSYPYTGEPGSVVERAEREMFDIVAVTAAPALEAADATGRSFSLRLLAEALRSDQTALGRILREVLDLDPSTQDRLARLLERTSLTSLVELSRMVVDRSDFLFWLDRLLFTDEWSRALGEKPGLHDILVDNTWVFGDQWNLMLSEAGLTQVAKAHERALLTDIDDPEAYEDPSQAAAAHAEEAAAAPVLDAQGRQRRLDLLLVQAGGRKDEPQYLVIELKRPSRRLTTKDLAQVENYLDTLTQHPRFANPKTEWTFVLVGTKCTGPVQRRRSQVGRDVGLVGDGQTDNGSRYKVWVRTWSEVLGDARQRLDFVRAHLETADTGDDLSDLHDMYRDVLPQDVTS